MRAKITDYIPDTHARKQTVKRKVTKAIQFSNHASQTKTTHTPTQIKGQKSHASKLNV